MRKDTRFRRPDRHEIESRLPAGMVSDAQSISVWNMMLQADDPAEVARWYRTYRDSKYCSLPKSQLRAMRDTMITAMREGNSQDPHPRTEKRKGIHYADYEKEWHDRPRKGV